MKKSIIIFVSFPLIFACSGEGNQNNSTQDTTVQTVQIDSAIEQRDSIIDSTKVEIDSLQSEIDDLLQDI